jgi:glutathione S-transferase
MVAMKLYRFRYSPYARKVQILLDLLGEPYELIEVPYTDRREFAEVTGGYMHVPVLVTSEGEVIVESRVICERLLDGASAGVRSPAAQQRLVPSPFEGPIWAYADFVDGPLEDILFRIASPAIRDQWQTAAERGLYVMIKERKFGAGCVDAWQRGRAELVARAQHLLAPTLSTLAQRPFLFGDQPTLADAALYGNCVMLEEGSPELLPQVSEALRPYVRRLDAYAVARKTA